VAVLGNLSYPLIGSFTFLITWLFCLILMKFANRVNALDYPDGGRKNQKTPVSFFGGTAILLSITFVHIVIMIMKPQSLIDVNLLLLLAIPSFAIFSLGMLDDFYSLTPHSRLSIQFIVSVVATALLQRQNLGVKYFELDIANFALSVFWIVLLCNALNLYDNTDLSASSAVFIAALGIFLISIDNSQVYITFVSFLLLVSILAFASWNKPPAKLYLGDSGALFLGVIIAVLLIQLRPTTDSKITSFLIPFFLVAVPVLDTFIVVITRVIRGISPFTAGRDHLSHILQNLGFSIWKLLMILTLCSSFFALLAVVLNQRQASSEVTMSSFGILSWLGLAIYFSVKFNKVK
jgi:UDP-GlcNAc:undecaprenyl-phosphate GlcNAc-1-phosphate transferase